MGRIRMCLLCIAAAFSLCICGRAETSAPILQARISFPESVHSWPITGRVFLLLNRNNDPQAHLEGGSIIFGSDIDRVGPDELIGVGLNALGFPYASLRDIPAGDYFVQAVLSVYSEFHRADGHVVWGHLNEWEDGDLCSHTQKLHLDPATGFNIKLSLTETIPPASSPADSEWVKHIKIQSQLLTKFWGRPMWIGAIVLLPKGYAEHPETRYPVIYKETHFSWSNPFRFEPPGKESGRGNDFFEAWTGDRFPRVIVALPLLPTPYNEASQSVNSANNGPYEDAFLKELIPYIEGHFRAIHESYARVLTGSSTGGWESAALQLYHPEFFGGAWVFSPDQLDLRRFGLINIYAEKNAFVSEQEGSERPPVDRTLMRDVNGQAVFSVRQWSRFEAVLGSKGRSGSALDDFNAAFAPPGADGYPKQLWNKATGEIDRDVATYMRDHGFDLRYFAESNWAVIGPHLMGKLHFYCGDMDNFYLNLGVYLMEDFLKQTKNPYYGGTFEYGRPLKGHGWQPMTNAELIRMIASEIAKNAPKGTDVRWSRY